MQLPTFVRDVSPWFTILVVFVGAGLLFLLVHVLNHKPNLAIHEPEMASTGDTSWMTHVVKEPKPTPTPLTHPVQTVKQAMPQAYHSDDAAKAARQRLMAAFQSPIRVKTDMDSVKEIPSQANQVKPVSLRPAPAHTLTAGSFFYAVLQTPINSDLPGNVVARVSQNVLDTTSQSEILIPAGTTIIGSYSDRLTSDQKRILVQWSHLTFPNGGEIDLPNLAGMDAEGNTGFEDQVDTHRVRTWGPALLISAIAAGAALATTPSYGSYQGYSGESTAINAGTNRMTQQANMQLASKLMMGKPTITVRSGYVFRIMLQRDLTFASDYQP